MKPPRSVQQEPVSYSSDGRLHQLLHLPFSGFSLKMDCPVLVSIQSLFFFYLTVSLHLIYLLIITEKHSSKDKSKGFQATVQEHI